VVNKDEYIIPWPRLCLSRVVFRGTLGFRERQPGVLPVASKHTKITTEIVEK